MKLKINYFGMEPRRFLAGTKGSYGFETLEPEFSPEWDGLNIKFVFSPADGREPVQVLYTGEAFLIPAEAYAARGICRFAAVGSVGDRTLITAAGELDILETLPAEAENAIPPTPSEISQIHDLAHSALTAAMSVQQSAERGDFDGKTPEIGEDGNWVIGGVNTGVYAVAHPINDDEYTTHNLLSADGVRRHVNRNSAGCIPGEASGKTLFLDDVDARHGVVVNYTVPGVTTLTGTPSADAPVDMIPVSKINISLYGRNLLHKDDLESGTIHALNGYLSDDVNRTRLKLFALPAGTYHWGQNIPARLHFFTADGVWLSSTTNCADFTMPDGAEAIRAVWVSALETVKKKPPVLSMSEDVSSGAWNKITCTVSLPDLNGVPGAQDTLETDEQAGWSILYRRTAELTLDGSENWTGGGGVYQLSSATESAHTFGTQGLCTHFLYGDNAAKNATGSADAIGMDGTTLYLYRAGRSDETKEQFCAWLAEQAAAGTPVRLVFATTSTSYSVLPESELLTLQPFESVMTMFSNQTITVRYQRDTAALIGKLIARITQLEDAITAM